MVFERKYGVATTIVFPMVKRAVVDLAVTADWTPATGDSKISKDEAAVANTTNLPAIAAGTAWKLSITATEMQAARITIQIVDSATKAVEDQFLIIETFGNASGQHAIDYDDSVRFGLTALPNAAAEAAGGLYTRGTGAGQINQDSNGRIDANAKAWIGGTIPAVNVTGVPKVDLVDWLGTAVTAAAAGVPDVNAKNLGGTAQTGRDVGASVLLSAGTGTGQLDFTSGVVKANLAQILGTALTETAGQIAAAFKKLFDVASPVLTATSVNQTGDNYARLGAPAGASVSADVAAVKANTTTLVAGVIVTTNNDKTGYGLAAPDSEVITTGTASAGAASTITLVSPASATAQLYRGCEVHVVSGTGAGQVRVITDYTTGRVATVDEAWQTNPDNTSVYAVIRNRSPKLDTSQQVTSASVQGNVTGSVASVTAGVTVSTNSDKTGYALTAGEHTNIATDAQTGLTAQGYTTARAGYLDVLNGLVAAIWNALTSGMTTAGSIGKKLADWVLGSDSRVKVSADAHTSGETVAAVTGAVGSVTGAVGSVTGAVGSVASGGITASSFAAGAIDAAAIATDAIGSAELAASAVTEIQSGLATAASISALNNLSAAQVNAEVVDALSTDTYAEPSAVPAATASLKDKLGWLAALARNKRTQTATTELLRNDADSASIGSSTKSDDGTVFTRGEWS